MFKNTKRISRKISGLIKKIQQYCWVKTLVNLLRKFNRIEFLHTTKRSALIDL